MKYFISKALHIWHNIKITLFSITSDEQQDVTYYTQYIVSQLHKKPKWRNSGAKAKYTHLCGCKWKLLYINNGNIWIIPIMHIWTLCVLSFWSLSIKICFHFKLYTYIYIYQLKIIPTRWRFVFGFVYQRLRRAFPIETLEKKQYQCNLYFCLCFNMPVLHTEVLSWSRFMQF